ncbi:hypothetical protein ACSFA3_09110 [Variovorax sp. RHLX14]|uniref:hypothetical protein n=1 Tax=Variovorax sp. RHLX14 TaxID=1259731 RepID=UPI003F489883
MKRLVVLVLSMALLAAVVFLVLREPPGTVASAVSAERVASETSARVVLPPAVPPQTGTQTPAWLMPKSRAAATGPTTPASSDSTGAATSASASASASARIARLNAIVEKLNRLQGQPTIDAKEVGAAIAELEKINGSPVMSGVRLDVLQENLLVADQMQATQKELQTLDRAPVANASERAALVQSKMSELAALRLRIRHDVMQSPAAGVSP